MNIYITKPTAQQWPTVLRIIPDAVLGMWCQRTQGRRSVWQLTASEITPHQITLLRLIVEEVWLPEEDILV